MESALDQDLSLLWISDSQEMFGQFILFSLSLMNVFLFLAHLGIMVNVHRGDQITGSSTNMEVSGETKVSHFKIRKEVFSECSVTSSLFDCSNMDTFEGELTDVL